MHALKNRIFFPLATVMLVSGLAACASTGRLAPPDPAVVSITGAMPAEDTAVEEAGSDRRPGTDARCPAGHRQ